MAGLLVTDADNTLWDTNRVFAEAQLLLLQRIEAYASGFDEPRDRLEFVRRYDQRIAHKHVDGLKYPPELLVREIADRLRVPLSPGETDKIVTEYTATLSRKPQLRRGVRATLEGLHRHGTTIIVASEGHESRVISNLQAHKLASLVDDIVVQEKSQEMFKRLFNSNGVGAPKVCIGDQLDRDIVPAKAAGFTTFYYPGGFRPSWEFDMEASDADYVIQNYSDIRGAFLSEDVA